MLCGQPPFRGGSEYLIFQEILARNVTFPTDMNPSARDLIDQMLQLDPSVRPTITDIKQHPFFAGLVWDNLFKQQPPKVTEPEHELEPAAMSSDEEELGEEGMERESRPSVVATADWEQFLMKCELIQHMGMVTKRRRPFTKKRMLLLTSTPRILYIDPKKMELRGEIPWTSKLWAEQITFYIHTPHRSYYMQVG